MYLHACIILLLLYSEDDQSGKLGLVIITLKEIKLHDINGFYQGCIDWGEGMQLVQPAQRAG